MSCKLSEIAAAIGAQLLGDPDLTINDVTTIEKARAGQITYVVSPKFRKQAESSEASAIICFPEYKESTKSLLLMKNPYLGFAKAMRLFYRCFPEIEPAIEDSARIAAGVIVSPDSYIGHNVVVGKNAKLGNHVRIMPGAYIGRDVVIGDNCIIFQNVSICDGVKIGKNVVIYPNAVIGSDGFGYAWDGDKHHKIPQNGTVIIEDNVEIGAGTTIDRATIGETIVGKNCIIDNLVQIAHNCKIGEGSVICAQVGLAGSTTLEKHVTLAGQVGVAGHLTIGENAIIEAQSGVPSNIPANSVYFGYPARDIREAHKIQAIISRLPEYIKRLRNLESNFKEK